MMRKTFKVLLLAAVLFSALGVSAQQEYNYNYYYYHDYVYSPWDVRTHMADTFKQITITTTDKKGKQKVLVQEYNKDMRLMKKMEKRHKKDMIIRFEQKMKKEGDLSFEETINYNRKGEEKSRHVMTFKSGFGKEKKFRQRLQNKYYYKGKLRSTRNWKYGEEGQTTYSEYLRKEETTPYKYWKYYYNEEKRTRSESYKKGKLKHVWSYDCHEEGALLEKRKNETQVCKYSLTKDSVLIRVTQSFDEKGRIRKRVSKYRLSDTAYIGNAYYNSEDQLIYEAEYNPDIKQTTAYRRYKDGELRSETIKKYEGKKLMTYTMNRKGELRYSYEYKYDGDRITEKVYTDKKLRKSRWAFTYEGENVMIVTHFNKKGEQDYEKRSEYVFFD